MNSVWIIPVTISASTRDNQWEEGSLWIEIYINFARMNKKEGGRYTLVALFSSRVRKGIIFNYAESNLDQNARAILLDATPSSC